MQPIAGSPRLEPGTPAVQAFHLLVGDGWEQVAVVADERLLGIVNRADQFKMASMVIASITSSVKAA